MSKKPTKPDRFPAPLGPPGGGCPLNLLLLLTAPTAVIALLVKGVRR